MTDGSPALGPHDSALTLPELEALMRAPEDCLRLALRAKRYAEIAIDAGEPVRCQQWLDVVASAGAARKALLPTGSGNDG